MGLWEKVQKELDRAGTVAKGALDEGKIRIELFRVRQNADKAAQALGYAVHRATREGREMEAEALDRLHATLNEYDAEAKKLEQELAHALGNDEATATKPETDTHHEDTKGPDA
jgi:hypothetical protein